MHLIYLDESGNTGNNLNDPQQPIFVLSALIVPVDVWQDLEKDLNACLKDHFPSLYENNVEVHATDLCSGRNEFKGLPIKDRISFRDDWMKLAEKHNLKVCYRAINKQRYARWQSRVFGSGVFINPQVSAFALLASVLDSYLGAQNDVGMFIFDDNKEVTKDIEKSIRILRGGEKKIKIENVIEKGFFIDSGKSRVLQLCDVFTYSARKKEEHIEFGTPYKHPVESSIPLLDLVIHEGEENFRDVMVWLKNAQ